MHIQVDCLMKDQVLSEKDVKEYDLCSENNLTRNENFVNFLKMTSWKQFCDFLVFLNKNCQSHLVNHMISFGGNVLNSRDT